MIGNMAFLILLTIIFDTHRIVFQDNRLPGRVVRYGTLPYLRCRLRERIRQRGNLRRPVGSSVQMPRRQPVT